ncbi:hypothetical protein [Streptacidiphilus sp. PAMC 29251]
MRPPAVGVLDPGPRIPVALDTTVPTAINADECINPPGSAPPRRFA